DRGQQFYKELRDRVRSLPGVRDAAITAFIPMGYDNSLANVFPEGEVANSNRPTETTFVDMVQPSYFRAAGVPVIEGREFSETDTKSSPQVAIINEAFAKKIWPGQNAVGKIFRTSKDGPPIQVVGLTRTGKYLFLYEPPQLFAYFPLAQRYNGVAT